MQKKKKQPKFYGKENGKTKTIQEIMRILLFCNFTKSVFFYFYYFNA